MREPWRAASRTAPLLVALAVSTDALGDPAVDEKEVCSAAYENAQRSQKVGKLVTARDAFMRCAADTCPAVVRQECLGAIPDIEKAIPTVVFDAVNADGKQEVRVRVTEGGQLVAGTIDGRPVALDPGPHKFRFESENGTAAVADVVLLEGQQRRMVRAELSGDASASDDPPGKDTIEPETTRPFGVWPWVVTGVGGGVLVSGIVLFAVGTSEVSEAEETCGSDRSCGGDAAAAELGNAGNLKVNLGVGFMIGGGAVIAGGLLWQLIGNQSEPVTVTPVASDTFLGLTTQGTF